MEWNASEGSLERKHAVTEGRRGRKGEATGEPYYIYYMYRRARRGGDVLCAEIRAPR